MILHDADNIMIRSIGADAVYHRGDLIWPLSAPASLTGVRFIDGSVHDINTGTTITLMEHNCSTPFWIEAEGEVGNIYAERAGSYGYKFDLKQYANGLFIIKDNAENNIDGETGYTCTINVWCDANPEKKSFTIKTQPEFADRDFLYTDKSCAFMCEDISADGIEVEREFFLADQWRGPMGSGSVLPIINEGTVGLGRSIMSNQIINGTRSKFGSYNISTAYGSKDYNPTNSLKILNARTDFGNCFVKYKIEPNYTGQERCFLIKINPIDGQAFKADTYIFMIQPSK